MIGKAKPQPPPNPRPPNSASQFAHGNWANVASRFGLAVFYHWGRAVGDDASVPITATYNQPSTWMTATLQQALCPAELVNNIRTVFQPRALSTERHELTLSNQCVSVYVRG